MRMFHHESECNSRRLLGFGVAAALSVSLAAGALVSTSAYAAEEEAALLSANAQAASSDTPVEAAEKAQDQTQSQPQSEEKPAVTVAEDLSTGGEDSAGKTGGDTGIPTEGDTNQSGAQASQPASDSADEAGSGDQAAEEADQPSAVESEKADVTTRDAGERDASGGQDATVAAQSEDETAKTITYTNMYRLYNPNSGEHFYTSSLNEAKSVWSHGWRYEGVGWVAPSEGTSVFRLYNPVAGDHHYTLNASERDNLVKHGWRYEGVGWLSDASADALSVYRAYNCNAKSGAHNFTISKSENDHLISVGWRAEGEGWKASNQSSQYIGGFWFVTGGQRYWVDAYGALASNRVIDPSKNEKDKGAWLSYAQSNGAIARGKVTTNGVVVLADNEGRPAWDLGWLVTGKYDGGALQRYYIVEGSGGVHGAKTGVFTITNSKHDFYGKQFYGTPGAGYVARGTHLIQGGKYYVSDESTGVLTISSVPSYVGDAFWHANHDGSPTNFFIAVDRAKFRTLVFQRSGNGWQLVKDFLCGVGKKVNGKSKTFTGRFSVLNKYAYVTKDVWNNYYYYAVDFFQASGSAQRFHSILYWKGSKDAVQSDGRGTYVSDGCVRLAKNEVKYIYDNCPWGTTVRIYD